MHSSAAHSVLTHDADPPASSGRSPSARRQLSRISSLSAVLREMGAGWLLYRLAHAAQHRTGLARLRNWPHSWAYERRRTLSADVDARLDHWRSSHRFFFSEDGNEIASAVAAFPGAVAEADALLAGQWSYFRTTPMRVGFPPQWNREPLSGKEAPLNQHWAAFSEQQYGDIKLIWEASRFGPVFALARAYVVTRDEKYPEAFWRLIESWATDNQPQMGPNWRCGQEASFRIMAWYFALHAFANSPHTTSERLRRLVLMIAVHAARIERNIGYALSQNNNHGVSEAVALWTVGLLSPELRDAERWRKKGRRLLERLAPEQIYSDGSYIQHSVMYHRLMLHDFLWAMRLGELNSQLLSERLYGAIQRAVDFLAAMVDPLSGAAPNYGSNDGACVLPLNGCGYEDLRPVLQAANYLVRREHLYGVGPWDEDLLWLFGPTALHRAKKQQPEVTAAPSTVQGDSGYFVMRGPETSAMIRCARYRHRPAQADQLHMDLRWRGLSLVCDAGTYLYNGAAPWENALAKTSVHNTVTVDDQDQMVRFGRFLWLHWAQGDTELFRTGSPVRHDLWQGRHDGYRDAGVIHRRAVLRFNDQWVVVDDVCGVGRHAARLQWLLSDFPCEIQKHSAEITFQTPRGQFFVNLWCSQPATFSLVRGGQRLLGPAMTGYETDVLRGWFSPSYAVRKPAVSVALESAGSLPLRFVTVLGGAAIIRCNDTKIVLTDGAITTDILLAPPGSSLIVRQ